MAAAGVIGALPIVIFAFLVQRHFVARADAGRRQVSTRRMTAAQALVAFLAAQRVERDGVEAPLFAGVLGIFGHGNVAGIGQALQQDGRLRFVLPRNEQAMVHTAVAYAKQRHRLQTWACTSSIGPGATNMVTGAALATINRLPVLLLPGDVFASRRPNPVLQQLEVPGRPDASVNDALAAVPRFFDRVNRPDQLGPSLLEAMRVLTASGRDRRRHDRSAAGRPGRGPRLPAGAAGAAGVADRAAGTGGAAAGRCGEAAPRREAAVDRGRRRPALLAGRGRRCGGWSTRPASRWPRLRPGKGALRYDHPSALGALGATGALSANLVARDADVVLAVGTRLGDFAYGIAHGLPGSGRPPDRPQRRRFRRRQAGRAAAGRRRPRRAGGAARSAGWFQGGQRIRRCGGAPRPRLGRRGGAADGALTPERPPRRR